MNVVTVDFRAKQINSPPIVVEDCRETQIEEFLDFLRNMLTAKDYILVLEALSSPIHFDAIVDDELKDHIQEYFYLVETLF